MTTEAPQAPRWLEYRTVDELPPAVANAKSHDLDALRRSVEAFGFIEPACIDERTGRLLGGHGRADYIRDLEATPEVSAVPEGIVVREDGRWTLPVTRGWSSRDDDHANAAAIALNRVGERGGWDPDVLAGILDGLVDVPDLMDATGFTVDELDELIASTTAPAGRGHKPSDDVPDEPADPRVSLGDVWQLGTHRLGCGDATDSDVWAQVLQGHRPGALVADPPYGMDLETDYTKMGHGGGKRYTPVIGDDEPFDPRPVLAIFSDVPEQWWWGADYYRSCLPSGGSWVVWDKRANDSGMDLDQLFGSVFELAWSRQPHRREIARILWAMTHGQQRPEEDAHRGLHPTQKPVALVLWIMERWVPDGDLVADPFAGSGTTLMACEHTGRRAASVELSPRYCDVILDRWERHSGVSAALVT